MNSVLYDIGNNAPMCHIYMFVFIIHLWYECIFCIWDNNIMCTIERTFHVRKKVNKKHKNKTVRSPSMMSTDIPRSIT